MGRGVLLGRVEGGASQGRSKHPIRSYLRRCSVRSAFLTYALAAVVAAVALSVAVVGASAALYSQATEQQTRYSGVYLYDAQRNALVPATSVTWYFKSTDAGSLQLQDASDLNTGSQDAASSQGDSQLADEQDVADGGQGAASDSGQSGEDGQLASYYIERLGANPEYYPTIYLDDPPDGFDMMAIADMDAEVVGTSGDTGRGASLPELSFETLSAYDDAVCEERGGSQAAYDALPSGGDGRKPLVSPVGYYVYVAEGTWADAFVWLTVVAVPAVCVGSFVVAARRFYRTKLQDTLEAMDAAAQRIASGDLDFTLRTEDGGELGRLCESFETMRSELDRSNRALWRAAENRRRANAAFPHDLRTPLTVLSGRAEMLAQFAPTGALGPEQVADVARAMQRQTARLSTYVESMRDLDALESYEPKSCAIDVREWFAQLSHDASDLCAQHGVACETHAPNAPGLVLFDAQAASRIAENLVGNATRHAESKVGVRCEWSGDALTLTVQDDGPGFSSEALEHACEPYWSEGRHRALSDPEARATDDGVRRNPKREEPHFGLGLNICTVLCEKLGGSLDLGNAPSGGGVATATIPAPLASCDLCLR